MDFLIGAGENRILLKETVERINDIQKMDEDTQFVLFDLMDTYIHNKTKKAFASNSKARHLCWACYNFIHFPHATRVRQRGALFFAIDQLEALAQKVTRV